MRGSSRICFLLIAFGMSISMASAFRFLNDGECAGSPRHGILDKNGNLKEIPGSSALSLFSNDGWADATIFIGGTRLKKLVHTSGRVVPPGSAEIAGKLADGKIAIRIGAKYSYCDLQGRIDSKLYDKVSDFSNGAAAVENGRKVFFINKAHQVISKVAYDNCTFSGGIVDGVLVVKVDDRWGYVATNGREISQPVFRHAEPFSGGFGKVQVINKVDPTNTYAFVNKSGQLLKSMFYSAGDFEGGYAPAAVYLRQPGSNGPRWGLIDQSGNWAVRPTLVALGGLENGRRSFRDGDLYGLMDKAGVVIARPRYSSIGPYFEGMATFRKPGSEATGYLDEFGAEKLSARYFKANIFSNGLASVSLAPEGKVGFINKAGNFVLPAVYESAGAFAEKLAPAVDSGRLYGFINPAGLFVIPPKFEVPYAGIKNLAGFHNGFCMVEVRPSNHSKFAYIDSNGKFITTQRFGRATQFTNGYAAVGFR